jgi:hypothetical protein
MQVESIRGFATFFTSVVGDGGPIFVLLFPLGKINAAKDLLQTRRKMTMIYPRKKD